MITSVLICFTKLIICFLFLIFGEWKTETSICCSLYFCVHWLLLVRAPTGDWTSNLGISGQCSSQLSYLPGAQIDSYNKVFPTISGYIFGTSRNVLLMKQGITVISLTNILKLLTEFLSYYSIHVSYQVKLSGCFSNYYTKLPILS